MDLQLEGKKALVSGSTKGIGLAIAHGLLAEGAEVWINGRTEAAVSTALDQLRQDLPQARVHGYAGDLSLAERAHEAVARVGEVDILVNNLGIFEAVPFDKITDDDWERFFRVNVLSGVRLARAVLPGMRSRNWGRIIFISSESGIQIPVEMIHYGMTKTAQLAVSRGLAELCAGTRITVNSVLPGPTLSSGLNTWAEAARGDKPFAAFEKEFFEKARPTSLIKRFASTDEVAHLVTYLASPLASATTGAALRVDGGVVKACF